MKKLIIRSFAAVLLSCGLILTSCDMSDPAKPLNYNTLQTATISGKVLVNTDESIAVGDRKWSAAPSHIVVEASVRNSSITGNPAAGGEHRVKASYNATTGEYIVKIPVSNIGSEVKITVKDFLGEVKLNVATPEGNTIMNQNVLWHSKSTYVSAMPNDSAQNNNILFRGEGNFDGSYTKLNVGVGTPVY